MALRELRYALVLLLVVWPTGSATAARDPNGPAPPLVVAVAEGEPFAIKGDGGTWSGLGVDLWREIAEQLGLRWETREVTLEQVDDLLSDRSVDLALGAIAVGAEGEARHDFSQAYYTTGLGFAERAKGEVSWRMTVATLASSELLKIVAAIAAAILVVGVLITLIERRRNAADFGGPWSRGVGTGVWWAAVTMTTVGYGDATPKTPTGRSLALVWMFVGLIAVATFTATVTSMLTIGSLQSTVQRPADLFSLRLGAVAGSAGATFLTHRSVSFTAFQGYEDALGGLANRKVDAVISNAPALRYLVSRHWQGVLQVSPIVLAPLSYAIGLPTGSPLRESIDRALLSIVEQDRWRDVEHRYLGYP
jgi:polar amino acid transport system substrate-binding protein